MKTRDTAENPSALDWDSAATTNCSDATNMPGIPRSSNSLMSCTLHDVQLPQSASASIIASQLVAISCRRSTGAPFSSFFGVKRDAITWSGAMTAHTSGTGDIDRMFCSTCGTHMTIRTTRWPTEAHLYAASLNRPEDFAPRAHFHYLEHLPWVAIDDSHPRYPGSADNTEALG